MLKKMKTNKNLPKISNKIKIIFLITKITQSLKVGLSSIIHRLKTTLIIFL
jgi:hypothetical protein